MTASTVLFDLDGTLTDPLVGIANSVRHALRAMSLAELADAELRHWVGPPLQESFGALGLSPDQVVGAIATYREYFSEHGLYENGVYPGVELALVALQASGLRLAVATSKPTVFAERILEHFGLAHYFETVVGSELDGTRVHKHDVIAEALVRLDESDLDTTVMVGDRAHDVLAAALVGIRSIGVAWGYAAEGELETAGASVVVVTPEELVEHLLA